MDVGRDKCGNQCGSTCQIVSMYAVVDTNVFVSAFITRHSDSARKRIVDCIISGEIIPVYSDEILCEYKDVLSRPKFRLEQEDIDSLLMLLVEKGVSSARFCYAGEMIDPKDRVFYEISLSIEGSFLVTGNLKHFPVTPLVVSPAKMLEILEASRRKSAH